MVFDTGSSTFEIPGIILFVYTISSYECPSGKNCTAACANQRKFDFDKSSTYKFIDDGQGFTLQFATGVGVDPVEDVSFKHTGFIISTFTGQSMGVDWVPSL